MVGTRRLGVFASILARVALQNGDTVDIDA